MGAIILYLSNFFNSKDGMLLYIDKGMSILDFKGKIKVVNHRKIILHSGLTQTRDKENWKHIKCYTTRILFKRAVINILLIF